MQLFELLYVRKLIIPMNRNTYYIYIRIATAYAISSAYIGYTDNFSQGNN